MHQGPGDQHCSAIAGVPSPKCSKRTMELFARQCRPWHLCEQLESGDQVPPGVGPAVEELPQLLGDWLIRLIASFELIQVGCQVPPAEAPRKA
eukprot:7753444-Lingulodinium_polyedra.AAC.1